ncbi:MAG: hypothetical protein EBZ91_06990, partial [Gammaproteobacteria bacterium]|nr:hypothetical protein [Gammaproteobacteria bacterium]
MRLVGPGSPANRCLSRSRVPKTWPKCSSACASCRRGAEQMRVLTRDDLEQVLGFEACIAEMRRAMIATSERRCSLPLRQFMPVPGRAGKLGLMPGYIGAAASGEGECFGVKIVSKFERPAGDPHGSHVGAVMLFDADSGLPLALLEGGTLTAIRTASMTALATDALARPNARRLLIVGTGEE